METTISKLNKHVEQLLQGITEYEPIEINSSLSHLLDMYSIPDEAKIACLTIDTSMRQESNINRGPIKRSFLYSISKYSRFRFSTCNEQGHC